MRVMEKLLVSIFARFKLIPRLVFHVFFILKVKRKQILNYTNVDKYTNEKTCGRYQYRWEYENIKYLSPDNEKVKRKHYAMAKYYDLQKKKNRTAIFQSCLLCCIIYNVLF